MKRSLLFTLLLIPILCFCMGAKGCNDGPDSDEVQQDAQEKLLKEGTAATGMPSIINFQERRLMKAILEKRDQANLTTYTYIVCEMTGKFVFIGKTIGYGLPYSTQYTNPSKIEYPLQGHTEVLPQADPNGLFSPPSSEGTWILLQNPSNPSDVEPVYIEPRIFVSPFPMPDNLMSK